MANEQTGQTGQTGGVGLPKGARVGKYEIVERLGMGGQAVVYKGYDSLLDRYVALKQISAHLASDEKFLERFRKEAQILAKLGGEQESIVTIHELIEEERGLFIVMEYLAGHSLETVLEDTKGPSEPKAVLQIIWRLAAAAAAAPDGLARGENVVLIARPSISMFGNRLATFLSIIFATICESPTGTDGLTSSSSGA